MTDIVVIANDIRSAHNVGSLMRTCEGLGISKLYLTGYTPYPWQTNDNRLPHIADKLDKQIDKTSLGAHKNLAWEYREDTIDAIKGLKKSGYRLLGLEQSKTSVDLPDYKSPDKLALLLGTEVTGIPSELMTLCDDLVEIPMFGKKESFNVVQAAAMALYQFRFLNK